MYGGRLRSVEKFVFLSLSWKMFDLENTVVNDVLCYISTARASLSRDRIVLNALAFYSDVAVRRAKDMIFDICKEKSVKRKACTSHPNPIAADLEDIYLILEKMEGLKFLLPDFVAEGYVSLPPSSGFESLASVMCSLRDEISALRLEVSEVRKSNEKDMKALDNVGCIIQDVAEIKLLIHNLPKMKVSGSAPENFNSQSFSGQLMTDGSSGLHYESSRHTREQIEQNVLESSDPNIVIPDVDIPTNSLSNNGVFPRERTYANATVMPPVSSNRRHSFQRGGTQGVAAMNRMATVSSNGRASFQSSRTQGVSEQRRIMGQKPRRVNINGTKAAVSSGLTSGLRILDIFVGGCGLQTSADEISNYCRDNDVIVKKCESIETKSEWYKSYKISIDASIRDKLLDAEFWPEGIFVRKFFRPYKTRV